MSLLSRIIKARTQVTAPNQLAIKPTEEPKTQMPKTDNLLLQATKKISEANKEAASIIEAAKKEAENLLAEARQTIAKEAEEAINRAMEQGYQAGYEEGFAVAKEEVQQKVKAALAKLDEIIEEAAKTRSRSLALLEDDFLKLSLVLAEKIIKSEISMNKDWLQPIIADVLHKLADVEEITIRLNADDFQQLSDLESLASISSAKIKWEPDKALLPGSCLISSEFGLIDASLDKRFLKLATSLQEVIFYE